MMPGGILSDLLERIYRRAKAHTSKPAMVLLEFDGTSVSCAAIGVNECRLPDLLTGAADHIRREIATQDKAATALPPPSTTQ